MQAMPIRIFLVLFILALVYPSSLLATTEQRTALVIGNGAYSSGPLKNPVNDATDMAASLQKLGFTVILKRNANLETMEEVMEDFGNRLKRGGVGLFYYAGHGVQVNGVNYLIPVGAKINKETDVRFKAFDAGRILAEMENANNGLNIVLLDACRDNPFGKSFRSASRGLAIVSSAPAGTFISYSTGPGQVARDGEGRNSPYTKALLQYVQEPGLTIEDVFKGVRQKLRKETGQVPWELSSLEGKFFFVPGETSKTAEVVKETAATPAVELDPQRREIEAERERLQKQRDLLEQKEALAKEKEELAERERKLAIAVQPSVSAHQIKELDDNFRKLEEATQEFKMLEHKFDPRTREMMRKELELQRELLVEQRKRLAVVDTRPFTTIAKEIGRDGRFIAYDNGTVLDTRTSLMWAAKDNGSNINWHDAKNYCENYRGGGYSDWRMPTQDELAGLHDKSVGYTPACAASGNNDKVQLTNLITMSCWAGWASETRRSGAESHAADFYFVDGGYRRWLYQSDVNLTRALPVRSGK
ncbi:MAG: caspase family protein [Syntrophales bacterium]|jgi:uncharacterized caspase-like protein|nr:caspase family protein [Syntrophales bacterium]